jgi:hypothetical protein
MFYFLCDMRSRRKPISADLTGERNTERCRKQFGSFGHPYELRHSPSGWCREDLVVDYLCWLRNWFPDGPLYCIMDQFSAHKTDQVLSIAVELTIEII